MLRRMTAWLLKTEPGDYSYDDLERDGTTHWDGVTNATAQMNMRSMQVGDAIVIYHSQSDKAAIGLGRVVRAPYPDPTDEKGKRVWVDVGAERRLARPVTLGELKADRVNLEFAYQQTGEVSDSKLLPPHLGVGMGVVDVRTETLQTVEEIARLAAAGVEAIGTERIALNPDCGFAPNSLEPPSIDEAFEKLQRLTAAARLLRGGTLLPCNAPC